MEISVLNGKNFLCKTQDETDNFTREIKSLGLEDQLTVKRVTVKEISEGSLVRYGYRSARELLNKFFLKSSRYDCV